MAKNVFGWTDIRSNTVSSLSNEYSNWNELRRELQGKEISESSIKKAMEKSEFGRRFEVGVHSFFPDKGIAYVGHLNNGKPKADAVISWDVEAIQNAELLAEVKELKKLVAKLVKD